MSIQEQSYKTTDTALATYLITEGFIPTEIDYSKPRYEFVFPNGNSQLQDLASKYITGQARVDPATFARINRALMRLIKNEQQWGAVNG